MKQLNLPLYPKPIMPKCRPRKLCANCGKEGRWKRAECSNCITSTGLRPGRLKLQITRVRFAIRLAKRQEAWSKVVELNYREERLLTAQRKAYANARPAVK